MTVVVSFRGRKVIHTVADAAKTTLGEIADATAEYLGQPAFPGVSKKNPYRLRSPSGQLLRRDAVLGFRYRFDANEYGVMCYRLSVQRKEQAHAAS